MFLFGKKNLVKTETQRWMNTAGAILIAANGGNLAFFGGFPINASKKQRARDLLENSWGIVDKGSCVGILTELVEHGMRESYEKEMQDLKSKGIFEMNNQQLARLQASVSKSKATQDCSLVWSIEGYRLHGKNALLGWDVARAAFNIAQGYQAGYMTLEEALSLGARAGKLAQGYFSCWEDLVESYLLGHQYWSDSDLGDPKSPTAQRRKLYEDLKAGRLAGEGLPNPYDDTLWNTFLTAE